MTSILKDSLLGRLFIRWQLFGDFFQFPLRNLRLVWVSGPLNFGLMRLYRHFFRLTGKSIVLFHTGIILSPLILFEMAPAMLKLISQRS